MTDTMQTENSTTETSQKPSEQTESTQQTQVESSESQQQSTANPSLFDDSESSTEEGDRPEWLPEKFKNPEDLSKSYLALEKKLGAHIGAPEEYEFNIPEPLEDYSINSDDPFAQDFSRILKENGVNQKTYNEISTLYFSKIKADEETIQEAQNQQFKEDCEKLGQDKLNEVKDSIKWAKEILPTESYDLLRDIGDKEITVGLLIKQFHDIYKSKNYTKIPDHPTNTMTRAEQEVKCRDMMKDPRMKTDTSYQKMVNDYYRSVYS